jgi:hypothetical protein
MVTLIGPWAYVDAMLRTALGVRSVDVVWLAGIILGGILHRGLRRSIFDIFRFPDRRP